MASRRPIIQLTGRGRRSGILASSAAVTASQRHVVEEEEENKEFSLSRNVLSKSEIERSSRLIFAPSSTLSISNSEKNLAETITRIACSDSVQKAVLESMMGGGDTEKNSKGMTMERLLLRVNRLESEIHRLKGEKEEHVHVEKEEEEDTAMSMVQWVSVSAVVVIVSALAYRYLSADAAKGIVDGVRNWFFGGRQHQ